MQQTVLTSSGEPGAPAIVVRSFEAEGPAPAQASIVIGPAMGVRQDFYAGFAQWLAGHARDAGSG